MEFLNWHYQSGLFLVLKRIKYNLGWILHVFSPLLLLRTLFSPYKRLVDDSNTPGFNLNKFLERLSFNIVSRVVGGFVRIILLLVATILIALLFVTSGIGLVIWVICPLIGLPYYLTQDPGQKRLLLGLQKQMNSDPQNAINIFFASSPGKYILSHLGTSATDLQTKTSTSPLGSAESASDMVGQMLKQSLWDNNHLLTKSLTLEDIPLAAQMWDYKYEIGLQRFTKTHYNRPSLGRQLLYGFTPNLLRYSTDMGTTVFSNHLFGREELVNRIDRSLSSGLSIMLTGQPGVGKKTVVYELAKRAQSGEFGPEMSYQRFLDLDYTFIISEGYDISQKKRALSLILSEAAAAGNIVLVVKDLHRLTNPLVEGLDFTDLFEKHLDSKRLRLISLVQTAEYNRYLAPNTRLKQFFDVIEAMPISKEDALSTITTLAVSREAKLGITILAQSLRQIISAADQYITDTPFPEKALELLDRSVNLVEKNQETVVTPDNVNTVVAETTGISISRLTESERSKLANFEEFLQQRLVGQDMVVKQISKSLRARSVGAKSNARPLGSFLLLGPTGVGKTETAKALAEVYFGNKNEILRFDMAEFSGYEGLASLIGSVALNQPGRLSTAIKNKPSSLVLLDEIEKARPEIYNLFLSLLDEGIVTDAFGQKINFRHCFVIATSNAGAEYIRELVGQGVNGEQLQKQVIEYVQNQRIFSPEFLNRFDGVIVFEPLNQDKLRSIAKLMLEDLKISVGRQGFNLRVADSAVEKIIVDGYQPQFGARPMRRIIDMEVGDVLGKAVLSGAINPGDTIELSVEDNQFTCNKVITN